MDFENYLGENVPRVHDTYFYERSHWLRNHRYDTTIVLCNGLLVQLFEGDAVAFALVTLASK